MFSWKKKQPVEPPRPYYPAEPPRPILKTQPSNTNAQGSSSIRFTASPASTAPRLPSGLGLGGYEPGQPLFQREPPRISIQVHPPPPTVTATANQARPHVPMPLPAPVARQRQSWESSGSASSFGSPARSSSVNRMSGATSSRRSSRPSSPSCSSFGARVRTESAPASIPTQQQVPIRRPSSMAKPFTSAKGNDSISTPPMPSSHVATPPMAYVSAMQARQPPPPSPYRPTTTHQRNRSLTRPLPEQLPMTQEMAPRPPRQSSLFQYSRSDSRSSLSTLPGSINTVPMLNIIPATPQETYEEFGEAWTGPKRKRLSGATGLEEAVQLDGMGMVDVPLNMMEKEAVSDTDALPLTTASPPAPPAIDVTLDFSPFNPDVELPMSDSGDSDDTEAEPERDFHDMSPPEQKDLILTVDAAPSEPLPPSPPFESYPSLPSLSSHASMPTSQSVDSMPSSSSSSSLTSFPDVEEALGSMLASLSDSSMSQSSATSRELPESDHQAHQAIKQENTHGNPGLGLGLGLGMDLPAASSITAPLSPRKPFSRVRPPPIDVNLVRCTAPAGAEPQSAPPRINHRVAFYGTAKVHPKSPTSGTFTQLQLQFEDNWYSGQIDSSSVPNFQSNEHVVAERERNGHRHSQSFSIESDRTGHTSSSGHGHGHDHGLGLFGSRDSISLASESSDDDLHTASIISLTPVMGRSLVEVGMEMSVGVGVREEVIVDDVGLAL